MSNQISEIDRRTGQEGQEQYSFGNPPPTGNAWTGNLIGVPPPPVQDPSMLNYRAYSLAQPFNLVERFKSGKPTLGFGLFLRSSYIARLVAAGGFDWIMLDWEHTPMSIRETSELIRWVQYASEGRTAAVVRLPNADPHWVAWALDSGASAIILPHTETAEQARQMIANAKFPNVRGKRSFPPAALAFGINDGGPPGVMPFDIWNNAAIIMQIESKVGCDNAEEIAAVEGVDCLMVGNGDLRLDLGLTLGLDGPEEAYNRCLEKVVEAGKKYKRSCLTFTNDAEQISKRLKQGFTSYMSGSDAFVLGPAMRLNLQQGAQALRKWESEGSIVEPFKF